MVPSRILRNVVPFVRPSPPPESRSPPSAAPPLHAPHLRRYLRAPAPSGGCAHPSSRPSAGSCRGPPGRPSPRRRGSADSAGARAPSRTYHNGAARAASTPPTAAAPSRSANSPSAIDAGSVPGRIRRRGAAEGSGTVARCRAERRGRRKGVQARSIDYAAAVDDVEWLAARLTSEISEIRSLPGS